MASSLTSSRRCIVSGRPMARDLLVRFVVGPDATLVPDIAEKLPGRGFWLSARRDVIHTACRKRLFAKAAGGPVQVPDDLADTVEDLLVRQCQAFIGLARRAGHGIGGHERVVGWLRAGRAGLLLSALDGAPEAVGSMRALADGLPVVDLLSAAELGEAFGRMRTVHGALERGGLAERLAVAAARLAGFRAADMRHDEGHDSLDGQAIDKLRGQEIGLVNGTT